MSETKTFRLAIDTDNAAFADEMQLPELARILRECAMRIENGDLDFASRSVRDVNGNVVGTYALKTIREWKDSFSAFVRSK